MGPPQEASRERGRLRSRCTRWWPRLRALAPWVGALAVLLGLVLAVRPQRFAAAAERFDPVYAPVVAALCLAYYVLQGVRWRPLLRAVGSRLPLGDTVLLNLAGQSTGLLPGGEVTRAVLVSEVARVEIGATIATITVQELIYTVLIIAAAVPGALRHSFAAVGVVIALVGVVAITVILTVEVVFQRVLAIVNRVPIVGRYSPDIQEIHWDTVTLLRSRETVRWSLVSALQALITISMFWVVVRAIDPGQLSWPDAAFVYAVAHLAGAVSLLPGGLGGFEAAAVGMLVALGFPFGISVAAALLQRAGDKGLGTVYGTVAYLVARRRYDLSHVKLVRHGQGKRREQRRSAPAGPAPRPA